MTEFVQTLLIAAIPLIFAITVHEAAHGYVASKFGDQTALMMGRVTLNPAKHIDPIGTVLLPLVMLYVGGFIFGWAKPVPVNWNNLGSPKRDGALVALAGPFSNLVMAFIWAMLAKCILVFFANPAGSAQMFNTIPYFIYSAAKFGIMINFVLMILNLIPIPPLDGSRVVSSILPDNLNRYYNQIERYGIWILLALLLTGILQKILFPLLQYTMSIMNSVFGLI